MIGSMEGQMPNKDKEKKIKSAVALSYEPDEQAPKVIAAGKGYIADRIISRAKNADIPLHKDEHLANTLSNLEIGSYIPPQLYEIVAEILIFTDKMDQLKNKVDYSYE